MGIRGRIFAATYDKQIKRAEKAGLGAMPIGAMINLGSVSSRLVRHP